MGRLYGYSGIPADLRLGPISPDGRWEARGDGSAIVLVDRQWKTPILPPHLPLGTPDPAWHENQARLAGQKREFFAAGYHLGKWADLCPWDARLRLREALAWEKAQQSGRAALASPALCWSTPTSPCVNDPSEPHES